MVEGIADQLGGGRKLEFVQEPDPIGTHGLNTQGQGFGDVPDGLALR